MEGGPTSIGPKTWDCELEVEEVHVRVKAASVGPGPVGGCRGTNMHEAHEIATKKKGTCNGNKNIAGVDAKKRRAAVVNVTTSVIVRKRAQAKKKEIKTSRFPTGPGNCRLLAEGSAAGPLTEPPEQPSHQFSSVPTAPMRNTRPSDKRNIKNLRPMQPLQPCQRAAVGPLTEPSVLFSPNRACA